MSLQADQVEAIATIAAAIFIAVVKAHERWAQKKHHHHVLRDGTVTGSCSASEGD